MLEIFRIDMINISKIQSIQRKIMAQKTYLAKLKLKTGGPIEEIRVQGTSQQAAKILIEAQFAGQIRNWFHQPREEH
jgi:hypothetical protein